VKLRSLAYSNLRTKQSSFTYNKKPFFFAYISKYLSVKTVLQVVNPFISVIAIVFCFAPFLLLWLKKLNQEKAYLFIAIYWLVNGIINLPECFGQSQNAALLNQITLAYNLLDTPLVLLVFYFAATGTKKRILLYLLALFILFECGIVAWKGHNFDSSTIIIGVGGLLCLIFSSWGIVEYFQKIEHNSFENAMGFIYAGFIFNYGLSIVIYIFNYLNFKKETIDSNLFIYYLSVISATVLTSVGLWKYARPNFDKPSSYK